MSHVGCDAAARHVHVCCRDNDNGSIDDTLKGLGPVRPIARIVVGFSAALALVRTTGLLACVHERHTGKLCVGLHSFAIPLPIPQFTVSLRLASALGRRFHTSLASRVRSRRVR